MNDKWNVSPGSITRVVDGRRIRLEPRGADLFLIRIDGVYIDTVEGIQKAKTRAMKALLHGEYIISID